MLTKNIQLGMAACVGALGLLVPGVSVALSFSCANTSLTDNTSPYCYTDRESLAGYTSGVLPAENKMIYYRGSIDVPRSYTGSPNATMNLKNKQHFVIATDVITENDSSVRRQKYIASPRGRNAKRFYVEVRGHWVGTGTRKGFVAGTISDQPP